MIMKNIESRNTNEFSKNRLIIMRLVAVTIIWIGITCLGYVLTSPNKSLAVYISIIGFLSFAFGILIFSSSLKNEIIREILNQQKIKDTL